MSDDPTLPQIVRALTRLSDQHSAEKQAIRDEYCETNRKIVRALEQAEKTIDHRETEIEFLRDVVADVCHRISRAKQQLDRDNRQCVYSEPLDILNLLGREVDPVQVIQNARQKRRRDEAKRCQAEPCPTQIDMGPCRENHTYPCAGIKGHPGYCKIKADDAPSTQEGAVDDDGMSAKCRTCSHDEGRHTRSLPEEGSNDYCTDCVEDDLHSFDGSKHHPEDFCNCGHDRKHHASGMGRCVKCTSPEFHEFRLARVKR